MALEIGNKNMPDVKLKKWGDETYIKVNYLNFTPVNPKQERGKIKWKNVNKEVHLYPIKKTKDLPEGFEFEIILKSKPTTNKIVLNIETKGLSFYYQPELNQKEKDEGDFRPENIVGSYAVYHESKTGNYEAFGDKNYMAGKAFHIYRPRMEDAVGNWVWGELKYDKSAGTLTTTIPQDFLNNAVYPIGHAAGLTFGYETIGGSTTTGVGVGIYGCKFNLSENGEVSKLTKYSGSTTGTQNFRAVVYDDDTGYPDVLKATGDVVALGVAAQWNDLTFPSAFNLVAGDYWLGWVFETNTRYYYDAGAQTYFKFNGYYDPIPDPFPADATGRDRKISIYATYTPEAPPGFTRKIKISGTFQDKPIKTKVGGTFEDKPIKIKVGGTFQDA